MLVGVAAAVLAGFLLICAAPFSSHCLYKAGGGLYLISGRCLFPCCFMCIRMFSVISGLVHVSALNFIVV